MHDDDEEFDPEHEAELLAVSLELDPLVRLYNDDRWEDICDALHRMDATDAKRLLGFSIAVMAVLMNRDKPRDR